MTVPEVKYNIPPWGPPGSPCHRTCRTRSRQTGWTCLGRPRRRRDAPTVRDSFRCMVHWLLQLVAFRLQGSSEKFKGGIMLCKTLKVRWIFNFVLRIFRFFWGRQNFFFWFYNPPPPKKEKEKLDLTFSNIPPTNTTSSSSTTSTSIIPSIPSTNRRSTCLHPHIYSRLWLFQQLLGQKLRVFICSELLWVLESNETHFPQVSGWWLLREIRRYRL